MTFVDTMQIRRGDGLIHLKLVCFFLFKEHQLGILYPNKIILQVEEIKTLSDRQKLEILWQ